MAVNIDDLNDFDLHQELIKYGFPKTPVTETTRPILIRKLKHHIKRLKSSQLQFDNGRYNYPATNVASPYLKATINTNHRNKLCSPVYMETALRTTQNGLCSQINGSTFFNKVDLTMNCSSTVQHNLSANTTPNREDNLYNTTHFQPPLCSAEYNRGATLHRKIKVRNRFDEQNVLNIFNPYMAFNKSFIPNILIGIFGAFFFVLIVLYADKKVHKRANINYDVCVEKAIDAPLMHSCIHSDLVEHAKKALIELVATLQSKSQQTCFAQKDNLAVEEGNILQNEKLSFGLRHLVQQNPQLGIEFFELQADTSKVILYKLVEPNFTFKCKLYLKAHYFLFYFGYTTLTVIFISLACILWNIIKAKRRNRSIMISELVKDIVNELTANNISNSEMLVSTLKDKILATNKHKAHKNLWNAAMELLNKDNKVFFGAALKNGEEHQTIKYVADNATKRLCQEKKTWQSPAFEKTNKINDPPTPCLKIRHMFEQSEANCPNLDEIISRAIVDKVGTACNIRDIQLDKKTCCVYVRCGSESDAGKVHNDINGWWFDKRLISIKFLRLERYFSRFPRVPALNSK